MLAAAVCAAAALALAEDVCRGPAQIVKTPPYNVTDQPLLQGSRVSVPVAWHGCPEVEWTAHAESTAPGNMLVWMRREGGDGCGGAVQTALATAVLPQLANLTRNGTLLLFANPPGHFYISWVLRAHDGRPFAKEEHPQDWCAHKPPGGWQPGVAPCVPSQAQRPDGWDDEADGEWEPPLMRNPHYTGPWPPLPKGGV
eukprot:TRINITY_DN8316_c0_g1_i1.p2 TRINITY_DN8316_c0_g1~~TRINITY_DN8316_c0_g1_i1.p2  ORF type:complete len:198 (+),score=58.30 TRINITY_DN8316_c0_g1_i1:66-659(+)